MSGYIARRRGRFYVVIYEGVDPATGKEKRTWHPAGADRDEAERLAKKLHLATSTYRGYERNVHRHIIPTLGRIQLRRLRFQQIEALYDSLLHPAEGRGLSAKTVYEIHLRIRGALDDAVRRGLVTRNVAELARAPKQRSLQKTEGKAWTDEELRLFRAPPPSTGSSRSCGSPP